MKNTVIEPVETQNEPLPVDYIDDIAPETPAVTTKQEQTTQLKPEDDVEISLKKVATVAGDFVHKLVQDTEALNVAKLQEAVAAGADWQPDGTSDEKL